MSGSLSLTFCILALSGFIYAGRTTAQTPVQPVTWSVSANAGTGPKLEGHLTLDLVADVTDGWHVYGLHQVEGGPTPLRITVDEQGIVQTAGVPTGTAPARKRDASFGLDTELYLHPFSLHIPLQIKPRTSAGSQQIALNVRFQACNDRVCLPPKTVHLTVPIQIPAETP